MTARVLVVDDIPANVKLLQARLTAEYFDVRTALSGQEALDLCARDSVDVILLDVMMPGLDGFEVCQRLKSADATRDVPVVMVTALDQPDDKIRGLEAGADDFLTKPVDEVALITRVKNLARVKTLNDEMRARAATGQRMGLDAFPDIVGDDASIDGRILLVEHRARSSRLLARHLGDEHQVTTVRSLDEARTAMAAGSYDVLISSLDVDGEDGLRLCSQARSSEVTRHLPIILLAEVHEQARLLRGLDMGVNDYVMRPIETTELKARVRTQLRKKRYADYLRSRLDESVEQAAIDPLTRLFNRRYLENHLKVQIRTALASSKPLSVLLADIDYFKSVNDTFGHDVGDTVLREFAERIADSVRGRDLAARLGGEEFVLVLPDTERDKALDIAERVRQRIDCAPFVISDEGEAIRVTTSIGVSCLGPGVDTVATMIKRADVSLYRAKSFGRNQVECDAA